MCAMDGALAHTLKYAPERHAQGALCSERKRNLKRKRERERERRKESRVSARARVLWTARSCAL